MKMPINRHENQPETMKILWKIIKTNQSLKTITSKKNCQRWLSPNNRISNNGNVCPKNIGIAFDHHASLHLALTKYSVRDSKI